MFKTFVSLLSGHASCLLCPELKAVAASESLFDGIWHYKFLPTQKYHAPFRSFRAADLLGG
jgi:hypothetical protein